MFNEFSLLPKLLVINCLKAYSLCVIIHTKITLFSLFFCSLSLPPILSYDFLLFFLFLSHPFYSSYLICFSLSSSFSLISSSPAFSLSVILLILYHPLPFPELWNKPPYKVELTCDWNQQTCMWSLFIYHCVYASFTQPNVQCKHHFKIRPVWFSLLSCSPALKIRNNSLFFL